MTLFPYVRQTVSYLRKNLQKLAELNDGKVQGPLAYLTDYFGLQDVLDDEWKRALVLGLLLSFVAFFMALFGNLLDPGETPEERERRLLEEEKAEEEEEAERERLETERVSGKDGIRGDLIEGLDDEAEDAFDDQPASPKERMEKELSDAEEEAVEEAKEATIEKWNELKEKQKPIDGGSSQFAELVEKLRPRWFTPEMSANLTIVSHLYGRLFEEWIRSHTFNSPLGLNAMLGGLYFRDYKDAIVCDEGHIDNSTLSRAHYYLQFAMASYASDLQSAGILLRSVKRACLGARGQEDPWLRHVLFVDHLTESVVLMFRGTSDFEDMVVDLLAEETDFMGGVAHKGLLEEAKSILAEIGPLLKETIDETGYSTLVLTGHSLGAGTAVLAGLLLREEHKELAKIKIKCYVFGSPPVVGPPEAFPTNDPRLSTLEVISFVHNADVICRTSLYGLELGLRLWIALDAVPRFGFKEKMQALMKGKLPEHVTRAATDMLQESDSRSKYRKMVLPGKCVWLMQKQDKVVVACPEDPTFISTQPMFMGSTWLADHSLVKYKAALESV